MKINPHPKRNNLVLISNSEKYCNKVNNIAIQVEENKKFKSHQEHHKENKSVIQKEP